MLAVMVDPMNTDERKQVRESLIEKGFYRTGHTSDVSGAGAYAEMWAHPDGTTLTVDWAPKSTIPTPERPHARDCGFVTHPHGTACKSACPTCGGKDHWAKGSNSMRDMGDPHPTPTTVTNLTDGDN